MPTVPVSSGGGGGGGGSGAGLLGSTAVTSPFTTTSTTPVQITGFTVTVTIPAGGRSVLILVTVGELYNTSGGEYGMLTLWDGTVGSGTQIGKCVQNSGTGSQVAPGVIQVIATPVAGSKTYNLGLNVQAVGTAGIVASATEPATISVTGI